jgi:hypothetical protein
MEPAHRGLTPRPLPGEPLVAMQEPSTISEVLYEQGAAEELGRVEPREERRGLFERIFGAFSRKNESERSAPKGEPGEKKKLTAYERMMRAKEDR